MKLSSPHRGVALIPPQGSNRRWRVRLLDPTRKGKLIQRKIPDPYQQTEEGRLEYAMRMKAWLDAERKARKPPPAIITLRQASNRVLEPVPEGEFVYFIAGAGLIKIGFTTDLDRRLNEIQSLSPVRVWLIHSFPGGYAHERELHRMFAPHRKWGEWFAEKPVLEWISLCGVDPPKFGTQSRS